MAQLQIPIDDSLMEKLKVVVAKNGTTLRKFVVEVLKQAVGK